MTNKNNAITEDNDEPSSVGVITAIEHIDGEMIPMRDVDGGIRNEWIQAIVDELEQIDGVTEVWGAGNTHANNQMGQFKISLHHTESEFTFRDSVNITGNVRSISQQISHIVNDSRYISTTTTTHKPTKTDAGLYRSPYYVIEFNLR